MTTAIHSPDLDRLQRLRAGNAASTGALLSIIEWLSGDECHALDEAGLISGLGRRLQALGLPLDRLTLHLMTLHPEFIGRTIAWAPGEPVEIHDREHGARVAIANTPLRKVMDTREPLVVGAGESMHGRWQHIDVFADRGLMQLIIAPLCNSDGPVSAAVFATRRPGGFSASEQQLIERILPALRNTSELRILRQVELSLLDTYIGPLTASRILAGRVRRGEIESMQAALLLCDLRGFTELSNQLPGSTVLGLLNAYFDRIVPAITSEGGELLKFMGDAVLAFFPGYDAVHSCGAALASARAILDEINRFQYQGIGVKAGIALHYGEVSYGNIGSGRRLDFTLIGGDVNLVSRIQTACSDLGEAILMSSPFRKEAGAGDAVSAGAHWLKGFGEPVELFRIVR
ncbi:adenylate/guanylate cyclase domain-containing protein [Rhizobium bangladeshense]|uniref:adenylate/guanylate cyclase domain-containing protein n=1 Tax=Rhizobium bangladeshense TaxID=1138189 RepID=UPI001C84067C|nr:adenylate/guanylate cyclase domain-containing protein [Rhizobium bangladeshense]MBX4891942.1 adenylate/guanylate cyclase domain-containing protein [Rhizobium bangladeshense]MBX4914112.1 adenylate/guanylate cyclase domain-containing protein [Rhizobium bangladeshense]MBX4919584.1 adenylate/guanylate cyclase domain-containing protein [Rhizobium bangladeshense]